MLLAFPRRAKRLSIGLYLVFSYPSLEGQAGYLRPAPTVDRAGTATARIVSAVLANNPFRPSAMVGWVKIASPNAVYGSFAATAVCITALISPSHRISHTHHDLTAMWIQ